MPDAVILDALRTPIGRYGGVLAPVRPDDLAARTIAAAVERNGIDPAGVDEVYMGCTNQAGEDNRNVARMASLIAGLPQEVPGVTVNRLCASGLEAVVQAGRQIRLGEADLVLAGGVESMSRAPLVMLKPERGFPRGDASLVDTTIGWRFVNPAMAAAYGTDAMPRTAQNLATERGISRADQDEFALRSQVRAAKAVATGRLAREITSVPVPIRGSGDPVIVDADEHPRSTTLEKLGALKPIVENGSITAGNSSGVNDGAAVVLLASEQAVSGYGLTPLARVTGAAVAGVPPRIMGIGPVPATRKLLARAGLSIHDVDVIELNEAFAAQTLAVTRELGLPDDAEHVNPNGGAIALGHPLGASGGRLALTAALELSVRSARGAVATMCIGVGQGISLLLETP